MSADVKVLYSGKPDDSLAWLRLQIDEGKLRGIIVAACDVDGVLFTHHFGEVENHQLSALGYGLIYESLFGRVAP